MESEVGRGISDVESPGAGVRPERFEWEDDEDGGLRQAGHDASEGLGRLAHGAPDVGSEESVEDDDGAEDLQGLAFGWDRLSVESGPVHNGEIMLAVRG